MGSTSLLSPPPASACGHHSESWASPHCPHQSRRHTAASRTHTNEGAPLSSATGASPAHQRAGGSRTDVATNADAPRARRDCIRRCLRRRAQGGRAMKECQAKVSRVLEQDLQERTERAQARRRENEKRKEVLRTASSIPHQEATSSLVKQMEKLIAPLKEEIRQLKEQGNTPALDAAGPTRAEERSGVNPRLAVQSRPNPRTDQQRRAPQATIATHNVGGKTEQRCRTGQPRSATGPRQRRRTRIRTPEQTSATPKRKGSESAGARAKARRSNTGR